MSSARKQVNDMLSELGRLVGSPLMLDGGGAITLDFVDEISCQLWVSDSDDRIFIQIPIGRPPRNFRDAVLTEALKRNRFMHVDPESWIALDSFGEELLLCCSLPGEAVGVDRLTNRLATLIAQGGELRSLLQRGADPGKDDSGEVAKVDSQPSAIVLRG